jgi:peptide/nickel transport system permease protein
VNLLIGAAVLIVGTFLMIHLIGGDPVRASLGVDAPRALVEQRRAQLHLDKPLPVQFGHYVGGLAHGDFGASIATGEPVSRVVGDRLANTVELTIVSMIGVIVISILAGLAAGALTSDGRHPWFGLGFGTGTSLLVAFPVFLVATLLVYIFAVKLGWLPVAGKSGASSFVLPALALGLGTAAYLARVIRTETVTVLSSEYIAAARSKRLPTRVLYGRHVLRNVLTNALTIAGIAFGVMLGGSVVIESIFAWPGIGTAAVGAIQVRDYPVIQIIVLMLGMIVLVVNTLVDVALALLDPRSLVAED